MARNDYFGRVLDVWEEHIGSSLRQDESAGATTLHLNDVDWAAEDGGDIYLKKHKEVSHYTGVNYNLNNLTGVTALTNSYPEGAMVEPWNPDSRTRWCEVHIEGVEYEAEASPVVAHIPGHLVNQMPVGTRRGWKEKVMLRRDGRYRLFVHDLLGIHGDMVTWMYQTAPDIVSQSGFWLRVPYDATMMQVRAVAQESGSSNTICNIYDSSNNILNAHNITIPSGKRASEWIKVSGDDGFFVEDDDRIRCYVDTIGTGVTGPIHFHIRSIPSGAA